MGKHFFISSEREGRRRQGAMMMHSSSSSSSGGNEEPWRRCRFKVAGKRWTLCSDRVALSAQAAPMPLASVGTGANSRQHHNNQQQQSIGGGRDSGASSAASSPNKGRQYGKYGAASAMSSSLSIGSSCKSVVAAFARAGAAAAVSRVSSRKRNLSSEEMEKKDGGGYAASCTSNPGGDSMTLLVLGNEAGLGIFDAAHVEDVRPHLSSSPPTCSTHTRSVRLPLHRTHRTHMMSVHHQNDDDTETRRVKTCPCD